MPASSQTTADPATVERQLTALGDPRCWEVVAALDEPKTGPELAADCEASTSTVYRKLDALTTAGLVETSIRVEAGDGYETYYRVAVDELTVTVDDVRRLSGRVDEGE